MSKKTTSKKSVAASQSIPQRLRTIWADKKPILIFVGGFSALMIVFYAFWFTDYFMNNILAPVTMANAWIGNVLLNVLGFDTQAAGASLIAKDGSFSVNIKQGCDALEPIAIFTFAVLLFPVSIKAKGRGLLVGIPTLLLLNQLRVVSLYITGIYSEMLFNIMHVQVWQVLFIAITLACLAYWILWAVRFDKLQQPAPLT